MKKVAFVVEELETYADGSTEWDEIATITVRGAWDEAACKVFARELAWRDIAEQGGTYRIRRVESELIATNEN